MGISAVILSSALLFGTAVSTADTLVPNNDGIVKTIPLMEHEINWNDDGVKLAQLSLGGPDRGFVFVQQKPKDNSEDLSNTNDQQGKGKNSEASNSPFLRLNKGREGESSDRTNYGMLRQDINDSYASEKNDDYENSDALSAKSQDPEAYKRLKAGQAPFVSDVNVKEVFVSDKERVKHEKEMLDKGYHKMVLRFPVTKAQPFNNSRNEFLNLFPFDDVSEVVIVGYASPDGKYPDMQIDLASSRARYLEKLILSLGRPVEDVLEYVCDKSIQRSECWRVDIFYKLRSNQVSDIDKEL